MLVVADHHPRLPALPPLHCTGSVQLLPASPSHISHLTSHISPGTFLTLLTNIPQQFSKMLEWTPELTVWTPDIAEPIAWYSILIGRIKLCCYNSYSRFQALLQLLATLLQLLAILISLCLLIHSPVAVCGQNVNTEHSAATWPAITYWAKSQRDIKIDESSKYRLKAKEK